jgi:hypothetical protein
MKAEDLWVGERVRIISSGRSGTFEGFGPDGRARIKDTDGRIFLVRSSNLEIFQDEIDVFQEIDRILGLRENQLSPKPMKITPETQIDLHIEVLAPYLLNELPARIHSFQVEACEKFISRAIERKLSRIVIIHGKGEGILKASVEHIARQYKEVKMITPVNDGGAMEIWMG